MVAASPAAIRKILSGASAEFLILEWLAERFPAELIVNPLDVERRGRPPGEKPARGGNVDIRILTSNFGFFILLPGKRTLAILLTGSNIPEGEAGAMLGLGRFSDALHAPQLSPPYPPFARRGKVGGVWSFFPLAKGGHRGVLRVPLRCAMFGIQAIENRSIAPDSFYLAGVVRPPRS